MVEISSFEEKKLPTKYLLLLHITKCTLATLEVGYDNSRYITALQTHILFV